MGILSVSETSIRNQGKSNTIVSRPPTFSPLPLLLWLDASDTSTITASSGSVSQWNDKSGNGRHVSQGTSTNRPTTGSTTKNSLNAITFDGTNDRLLRTTSDSSLNVATRSVFIVGVNDAASNERCFLDIGLGYALTAQGTTGRWYNTSATTFTTTASGNWFVFSVVEEVSVSSVGRINAGSDLTLGTPVSATGTGAFGVGSIADGTSLFLQGSIGEIIIYANKMSARQRLQVENYLLAKWGL
jgi:hypothetical protein